MILNYIFSIFFFFGSAFLFADLYLQTNKKYEDEIHFFKNEIIKKKDEFNQKGFGTLLGITLLFLFSSIFYFFLLKFKIERNEINYRKNLYLCFHDYQKITNNYVSTISKLNIGILALEAGEVIGVTAAEAELMIEGIMTTQNLYLISTMKKISSIKWCTLAESQILMLNLPYEKDLSGFKRSIDRTTYLGEHKWEFIIGHREKNTRLKNLFTLKIKGELKSNLSSKATFYLEEMELKDLLNLKPFFGSL